MIYSDGVVFNDRGEAFDPSAGRRVVNDPRGLIESISHEPVNSIIRIYSRAGSVRSNHYHKTDWHICYVVAGRMEYYEREVGGVEISHQKVTPGDWVRTGPMVEHTTVFPVDTEILVFAGNVRDEVSYLNDLVHSADLSALF